MPTSNQIYFDSALRHQIGVRRFASGEARRVIQALNKADRELVIKIRERLARLGVRPGSPTTDFRTERFRALLRDVRDLRREVLQKINEESRGNLYGFARMEVDFEQRLLQNAIPFDLTFARVDAGQVRSIVTSRPFQGRHLREWYSSLEAADRAGLRQAIQQGLIQGESIDQIVRRIAGTRANGFRDGVLSTTRRQAEAITRTAVNHVSNRAREEVWKGNEDIILALRWTATLDGRTSAICRARDGALAPVGGKPLPKDEPALSPPDARPPAHVNCRSVMVAILDPEGVVGDRPFITDTRGRGEREVDFRAQAKAQGRSVSAVRAEWARQNIGQVPAKTSYDAWLRTQSNSFQNDVLGRGKAELFREGLTLDRFVDRLGNELNLDQLAELAI